jgi:transcription initiation factor TFIIE subunit alpha
MIDEEQLKYVVNETFGKEALPITEYLIGKKNISEFIIAKDLSIEIHRIRQILYKLLENNIVAFIRKKDKIKGWYICYWSLNEKELPYVELKIKKQKIQKLKQRLDQESDSDFFMCKNACTRMNFDSAFELNFKCPDCGEIMHQQDNQRTKEFLTKRIKKMEQEIQQTKKKKKPAPNKSKSKTNSSSTSSKKK